MVHRWGDLLSLSKTARSGVRAKFLPPYSFSSTTKYSHGTLYGHDGCLSATWACFHLLLDAIPVTDVARPAHKHWRKARSESDGPAVSEYVLVNNFRYPRSPCSHAILVYSEIREHN